MQLLTICFPALLLFCATSFLPLLPLPPLPFVPLSPGIAITIIISACAYLSFSTLKATADNQVVINRPLTTSKPSLTTVIILGWGGARRRHLRRLEEWYLSQGVATLSYSAPFSVFFYTSNSDQLRKLAAAALDEVSLGQVTPRLI
jgi:hypothetical protein